MKNDKKEEYFNLTVLNKVIPEVFYENSSLGAATYPSDTEQDLSMQQNEEDFEILHRLIQERSFTLYKKRSKILNDYITDWFDDLADWFEAERQILQETENNLA